MKKIAVLFSGTGSNLEYLLANLHGKEGVEIALTLCNVPTAHGTMYPKLYNVPLEIVDSKEFESREAFDGHIVKIIQHYGIDLVVLAGFMRILTPVFTEQVRAINLHPSLLPRHKGLHAIEKSFADEYNEGGVSVHWVTSELDGGQIILQMTLPKGEMNLAEYEKGIKKIEKIALTQAIKKVLNTDMV